MGIFEVVGENRSILPFNVPDTDIMGPLSLLKFNPASLEQEVSVSYVTGVLVMHRDAMTEHRDMEAPSDLLGTLIQKYMILEGLDLEKVRERVSRVPLLQALSPPKIPWALYELVAETVRLDLATVSELREYTTPTMFPFLLGVYSLVSHPLLVAQAKFQSIEGLIGAVNTFGKKLNTVTDIRRIFPEAVEARREYASAAFQRTQHAAAREAFERRLTAVGVTSSQAHDVVAAICARDLATTIGALVGGSILKAQRIRYTEVDGNATSDATIRIYYPPSLGESTVSLSDAWMLARTKADDPRRQRYLRQRLEEAVAPLQSVALRKAKEIEIELKAELVRREEAARTVEKINQLARGAAHDIRNPLTTLSNNNSSLYFDDVKYFAALPEATTDPEDAFYHAHQNIVRKIGHAFVLDEKTKRGAVRLLVENRYDAYERAVAACNEKLHAAGKEEIPVLRRVAFDPLVKGYLDRRRNASYNILASAVAILGKGEELSEAQINELAHHWDQIANARRDGEEIIENLYLRTRFIGDLAKTTRYTKVEELNLDKLIEDGSFLFTRELERPALSVVRETGTYYGNPDLVQMTIENILKNARYETSRDLSQDIASHTIVIFCPEDAPYLYIGNTGPAIPADRMREIFTIEKRLRKDKDDSDGISLANALDHFRIIGGDLFCYTHTEIKGLQDRYEALRKYPLRVLFGMKLLTRIQYDALTQASHNL